MSTIQIGVDLAKSVFEAALSPAPGVVVSRRRLSRTAFPRFLAGHPPAEVLFEACGSAHHWGRAAQRLGHHVTLLHPADVARYRDGNKTDRADATALLEAARNQALSPVPVKSVEQQAVVALHRIRQGYLRTRTARINALRGHLRELGHVIPLGAQRVAVAARAALADETMPRVPAARPARAARGDPRAGRQGRRDPDHAGLADAADVRGPAAADRAGRGRADGPALVAFVGDIQRFPSGRHFASWLGLTPREHSSGASRRLGSITHKGNS